MTWENFRDDFGEISRLSGFSEATSESGVVFGCGLVLKLPPKSVWRLIFEHFGMLKIAKTHLLAKRALNAVLSASSVACFCGPVVFLRWVWSCPS